MSTRQRPVPEKHLAMPIRLARPYRTWIAVAKKLTSSTAAKTSTAQQAIPYLKKPGIDHKISIESGRFNTLDLSTRQRKRLALVHACLESRPIIVFDEWAADQDPHFRHIFYTDILPESKKNDHLLVVISHDDRYFSTADRIIKIDQGNLSAASTDSSTFDPLPSSRS